MRSYASIVSFRTLFALFVALAVLFAPGVARAGEAFTAMPDHQAQMMEAGHCQMPPSKSADHDKMPGKSCCISMCMAIAVTPAAPDIERLAPNAPAVFALPTFHTSAPPELATPPPRS